MDLLFTMLVLLAIGLGFVILLNVRRPWGRFLRRLVLPAFLACVVLASAMMLLLLPSSLVPDFGGNHEYTELNYERYRTLIGEEGLDPVGATDISFRCHSTRDSYDIWLRMHIDPGAYESLLAQWSAKMKDLYFASYRGKGIGPVRQSTHRSASFPENWPEPETKPPGWWNLPHEDRALACTRWELQVDDSDYSGRAKGWYWLYDSDEGVLWIWEWNRQHFSLGWDSDRAKRPVAQPGADELVR
jgi:hypothetical protein